MAKAGTGLTSSATTRAGSLADRIRELWTALRDYFGALGQRRIEPVRDAAALRHFLETRASFVAQTSLYGYLRTRAGMLYPQLFDNDDYVRSINVAKWHLWLACLADLSVYAGGLLARNSLSSTPQVSALMQGLLGAILADASVPAEAGDEFAAHVEQVRARITSCDWVAVRDDETPFSASPAALVRWAPIVETLKELDQDIVRNSVRFRWQEVRRDLRAGLDADAVLRSARSETKN